MASELETLKCYIGHNLKDACHSRKFVRHVGLNPITDLPQLHQELLSERTELATFPDDAMVCLHHEKRWISKYESLQKHCADPHRAHAQKKISTGLRKVPDYKAGQFGIKRGQKLCNKCLYQAEKLEPEHEREAESRADPTFAAPMTTPEKDRFDNIIQDLNITPLKHVGDRDRSKYLRRKSEEISSAIMDRAAKRLNLSEEEVASSSAPISGRDCTNCASLIEDMKKKFKTATRREKIQMLTALPHSLTIEDIYGEFLGLGVSYEMIKQARKLRSSNGLFSMPAAKAGRPLSKVTVEKVRAFYQEERNARVCPGMRETITVKNDSGVKEKVQKCLLLSNINELYRNFKNKNPEVKIGIAKFYELRPLRCKTVNDKGMHNVCVCQYHQNVKLMVEVIPGNDTYHDLMEKLVCDSEKRECMLHYCPECPGVSSLSNYLSDIFAGEGYDDSDEITFKQWVSTDRTTLINESLPVDEFIEKVCDKMHELRIHAFIAKSQSSYYQFKKENLKDHEVIAVMDFSENYSFIVQNSPQGYHWNNKQITLHPVALYYKENGKLVTRSICCTSDMLEHSTNVVHAFQKQITDLIKEKLPHITKVLYFSDGSGAQYKNYKNIINLCHHKKDFGLDAEWHYYATSHGKGPSDAIGGTVKSCVARASLQADMKNQVTNLQQFLECAKQRTTNVSYLTMSEVDIKKHVQLYQLEKRYLMTKTIPGTRSHHCLVPISSSEVLLKRISEDDSGVKVKLFDEDKQNYNELSPGKYVVCNYDGKWYVGCIEERSDEHHDIFVNFMRRQGRTVSWPPKPDKCWIPFQDVIRPIPTPSLQGHGARQYSLDENSYKAVAQANGP